MDSHEPKLTLELTVFDSSGSVVQYVKKPVESFLYNWALLMYGTMSGIDPIILCTDGTSRTITLNKWSHALTYYGSTIAGIIVGSSSVPVSIGDNKLVGLIPNGTGTGQLVLTISSCSIATISGSICSVVIHRLFTNNSGGTVIVRECGIYCSTSTYDSYCVLRDVTGDISVGNTQVLEALYTLSTTTA